MRRHIDQERLKRLLQDPAYESILSDNVGVI